MDTDLNRQLVRQEQEILAVLRNDRLALEQRGRSSSGLGRRINDQEARVRALQMGGYLAQIAKGEHSPS